MCRSCWTHVALTVRFGSDDTHTPIKRMDKAVTAIARKLGEVEAEPLQKLEQVVKIIGIEQAHAFCDKALEIEKQGGMMSNW